MSDSANSRIKVLRWQVLAILVVSAVAAVCSLSARNPEVPAQGSLSRMIRGSSFDEKSAGVSQAEAPSPAMPLESGSPPTDDAPPSKSTGAASPASGLQSTGETSRSGLAVVLVSDPVRPGRPDPAARKENPNPDAPAAQPAKAAPNDAEAKPKALSFSALFFRYWPRPKEGGGKDPFPDRVRALNGSRVQIDGYVIPLEVEKGKMKSFLLSRGPFGCCFADSPQISEMIKVSRADGKPSSYFSMARVTGILEVGEEFDADGFILSVFRMKAEAVEESPQRR